jgi:hypothetical protein
MLVTLILGLFALEEVCSCGNSVLNGIVNSKTKKKSPQDLELERLVRLHDRYYRRFGVRLKLLRESSS